MLLSSSTAPNLRSARRVRKIDPTIPIVKYVAPQVWAWRPHRAKKMRAYIDEILALLPFEPQSYKTLDGPRTTYVGHPLTERRDLYELKYEDQSARKKTPYALVILPGSRASEVKRLLKPFGDTVALLSRTHSFETFIPVVPHLRKTVEDVTRNWPKPPTLVQGMEAKWALFRRAHAALAASGTVTLELALAQVPMIVAYKVEGWMEPILRRLIYVNSIVLPNLIVRKKIIPEFYQKDVCAEVLTPALKMIFDDRQARNAQLDMFKSVAQMMKLPENKSPADVAAERVLANVRKSLP